MFIFDLVAAQTADSIIGDELKKAREHFLDKRISICLQIKEEPSSKQTSYRNYCTDILSLPKENDEIPSPTVVINTFLENGSPEADPPEAGPLVVLLKNLTVIISCLDPPVRSYFIERAIKPSINLEVMFQFAPEFAKLIGAPNSHSKISIYTMQHLANELLKLIQSYCMQIGRLVIVTGNTDDFSHVVKDFFVNLLMKMPSRICLVTMYTTTGLNFPYVIRSEAPQDNDIKIIIDCFKSMMRDYLAKSNMVMALKCCKTFAKFISHYTANVKIRDLDIALMIFNGNTIDITKLPFKELNKELHEPLLALLSTMCMICHFADEIGVLREYVYWAYQLALANKLSRYTPIIEAYTALVLTQSAELRLERNIISQNKGTLDLPSFLHELETYKLFIGNVATLNQNVMARLKREPSLPEHNLAWHIVRVITGCKNIPFNTSWQFLENAYKRILESSKDPNAISQAILAFVDTIALWFCAGVRMDQFRDACLEFIRVSNEFRITASIPFVQGFLDLANCFLGKTVSVDLNLEITSPDRFFKNFSKLGILFLKQEHEACVQLAEAMYKLEFGGDKRSTFLGYTIYYEFLSFWGISLVRSLEGIADDVERESRIERIKLLMKLLSQYAIDCPANFDYRNKFLIAEIHRCKFSKLIHGYSTAPLREQEKKYEAALQSARLAENHFYVHHISLALEKVKAELKRQDDLQMLASQQPQLEPTSQAMATLVYKPRSEHCRELFQLFIGKTQPTLALLFILTENKEILWPGLLLWEKSRLATLIATQKNKYTVYWDEKLVQNAAKKKKLFHYNSDTAPYSPFFNSSSGTVKNVFAIPIIENKDDKTVVRAVLYTHGSTALSLSKEDYVSLMYFAKIFCTVAYDDKAVFSFTKAKKLFDRKLGKPWNISSASASATSSFKAHKNGTTKKWSFEDSGSASSSWFKKLSDGSSEATSSKSSSTDTASPEFAHESLKTR